MEIDAPFLNYQQSELTDNHQQESGSAEPIIKRRGFFSYGQKISMFNSSALGANYTAEKNDRG